MHNKDVGQIFRLVNVKKKVFHTSTCLLQFFMYASCFCAKLRPMMDMAFFTCLWCSYNTLGSALESGAFLDPSTMSQKSTKANTISILNFQRLNFSPYNLFMTLAVLLSRYAIFTQRIDLCA